MYDLKISVRKRGEKWEYRFDGAPVGGKRKQISKSGFKTEKQVKENVSALDFGPLNQDQMHEIRQILQNEK